MIIWKRSRAQGKATEEILGVLWRGVSATLR